MFGNLPVDFSVKCQIGTGKQCQMFLKDLGDLFFQRNDGGCLDGVKYIKSGFDDVGFRDEL